MPPAFTPPHNFPLSLELDSYERDNLLWLLNVAQRIGLSTGDWLGQIRYKLLPEVGLGNPNCSEDAATLRIGLAKYLSADSEDRIRRLQTMARDSAATAEIACERLLVYEAVASAARFLVENPNSVNAHFALEEAVLALPPRAS